LTDRYEIWYGDAYCPLDRADRQNFEILKIHDGGSRHSDKKSKEIASLTDRYRATYFIFLIKSQIL